MMIRGEEGRYSIILNLAPAVENQAKAIALGLRLALSARFGKSSIQEERELLSRTTVEAVDGTIRMEMKDVGLEL